MPLFIKALPLSLQTFWRYLILLPFLAIGAFFLYLFAFIPILGMMVPGTISAGLIIIGLRCALAARGHGNPLDTSHLLTVSLAFCAINFVAGLVLNIVGFGLQWAFDLAGVELDPIGLLAGLFGASVYWTTILLVILAPGAIISAAFAVPMTAAAHSATPKDGNFQAFFGFGYGLFSLLIVMAFWMFGGHFYSIFGEVFVVFGMLATAIFALVQGESIPWEMNLDAFTVLRGMLVMAWASSWYFATAVLAWERKMGSMEATRVAEVEARRMSAEDVRALRLERMKR